MLTLCAISMLSMPHAADVQQSTVQEIPTPTPIVLSAESRGLQSGSLLADLNGDGVVDFIDVSLFINCYNAGAPCADINGDGVVNFFDISLFISLCDA
jgi:hypothetical protein